MKTAIITFITLACTVLGVYGQGAARVAQGLDIRLSPDAAAAINAADHNPARQAVTVYGVRLFSDNSQSARENAYAAAAGFTETHPEYYVVVNYESPHFLVTAGRFVDRTDAVALCGQVLSQFPKAMVVQQEVPLAEVIVRERAEPEPGPEQEPISTLE